MVKKPNLLNLSKSLMHCSVPAVIFLFLIGFSLGAYALDKNKSTATQRIATVKTQTSKPLKSEPKTPQTTPATSTVTSPATTPATVAKPTAVSAPVAHITTGSKPAPVIVPSPSSNVSSLTPTPTSTSTSTSTPTSTSSSSSPSGSSSSSSSQTQTTGYTSTNWSGYLDGNGTFTKISGTWTVPSPTGNDISTSADASWIGIGGVSSNDLIQIGTDNTVSANGQISAEVFYEILPAASVTVPSISVTPGDQMSASITETSSGQWAISIIDNTNNQSWSDNLAYNSTNSSAEWIEEDPSYSNGHQVPFDKFGSVSFTSSSAILNGNLLDLSELNAQPVTMVSSHTDQPVATPSAINSGGNGFSVTAD